MVQVSKYGYKPPVIKEEDYEHLGGGLPDEILQPDGQWSDFAPTEDDFQSANGVETYNCTGEGLTHQLDTYIKRKYGGNPNHSPRYVGIMAGTGLDGNSPDKVYEVVRTVSGMVDEEDLPFPKDLTSIDDYYKPKPMLVTLLAKGLAWLKSWTFKHEWVYKSVEPPENYKELIKESLKRSPLAAGVYAWAIDEKGLYYSPPGSGPEHWIELYGFKDGEYWYVFDSYDLTHKVLRWDFKFYTPKRIFLSQISLDYLKGDNWFVAILKHLWEAVKDIWFYVF